MAGSCLEVLEKIEEERSYVARASKKVLREIYEENVPSDSVVLETGCGIGYLKRSMPFHEHWVQLDIAVEHLGKARELDSDGVYVCASALCLPLRSRFPVPGVGGDPQGDRAYLPTTT